ncbi:terpene synthase family protein [Streptomyces sp. YGL11-2]|uniref:terpene synthase family protein n=1 Tax=Streptomyces sp. YGL11-2 TaxID=3414028 RepID=UPI003CF40BE8
MHQESRDGPNLPGLAVPFPLRINPHLATARHHDMAWAKGIGLVATPTDELRYRSWDLALLVAGWLPDAPPDGVDLAVNAFNWCTVCDDLHAGERSTDSRYARRMGEPLLTYLATGRLPGNPTPLLLALDDIVTREMQRSPHENHARIAHNWALFVAAFMEETKNRKGGLPLGYHEYRALRMESGAVHLMTDLIEIANGYHVTAGARSVPAFRTLFNSANEAICYINDLYSHPKEEAAGDQHNLVFVFENAHRCTRQEAIERTVETILDACDNMLLQQSRLRTGCRQARLLPKETAGAHRFSHDLIHPISSIVSWHQKSGRYARPDNAVYESRLHR